MVTTSQNDPFAIRLANRQQGKQNTPMPLAQQAPKEDLFSKRASERGIVDENEEGFLNSSIRTVSQIPLGVASTTTPGLLGGLWEILATGEVYDQEDIEHLKKIAEREGVPFDEEAYYKAAEKALGAVPTVSNLSKLIESGTGIPLEPKTRGQKALRFATEATRLAPNSGAFKGMEIGLPKPILGAGVSGTKEVAQELGIPEPLAELGSFAILKQPPKGASSLSIGQKTKPSGMPIRRFEDTKKSKTLPASKIEQINNKLESDFRKVSDNIIKESPIGETAKNLAENPIYKQESRELLDKAQEIANSTPGSLPSIRLKTQIADTVRNRVKGYAVSEYDKNYSRYMKEAIDDIFSENISAGQLVEQYRKNNSALTEYFEPGSSKAQNRAKKDALLDHNRAIANVMEKSYPNSELIPVFKEGNARWTKIMDTEAVDNFVSKVFDGNVNFKKVHDFFDKEGHGRIFKRALGEKGFNDFQQLMKDMLTSETPYKMLKVAKEKGYEDLFRTGIGYVLHPKIGMAKAGFNTLKYGYKGLMNALIDKPKLGFTFKKGIEDLKKGNFASAEKEFIKLHGEVLPAEKASFPEKTPETINVTPEIIQKPKRLESVKK